VLLHVFAAVWVGSREISSDPPGEAGGFRFRPILTEGAAGQTFTAFERTEYHEEKNYEY
jgi:hypothetical protein